MNDFRRLAISEHLQSLLSALCGLSAGDMHTRAFKLLVRDVCELSGQYVFSGPAGRRASLESARQAQAYLAYYLPVNLIKLHPILNETAPLGVFSREHLSILDLGCGPGTASLGVLEYLAAQKPSALQQLQRVTIRGIDRMAENVALARQLVQAYSRSGALLPGICWDIRFERGSITSPADIERAASPVKAFTIIAAGNVVNEIAPDSFAALASCVEARLAEDGVAILMDPGTCRSAKKLYRLREEIRDTTPLRLYAPCLHAGACPLHAEPDSWCHEKIFWDPPLIVQAIDRYTGFSKAKGIKYSYYTFVRQRGGLAERVPGYGPDTLWRVVSYRIRNKGEDRLYVCNGRERRLLRRLTRNESAANRDFGRARRGDIVWSDALVPGRCFWEVTFASAFIIARASCGGPGDVG